MNQSAIIASLVIALVLGTLLYVFVFKKSEEPQSEIDIEEELEEIEEEVTEPSPDTIDDVMTGGDDEPIPVEDETSLETGPADDEVEEEIQDEKLMVYILSKVYNFFLSCFALRNEHPPPLTKINMICAHCVFPS